MLDNLSKSLARFHQVNKVEVERLNEISESIKKVETFLKTSHIYTQFVWAIPTKNESNLAWEIHCSNGRFRLRLHYRDETDELKKVPFIECKVYLKIMYASYLEQFIDAFTLMLLENKDK